MTELPHIEVSEGPRVKSLRILEELAHIDASKASEGLMGQLPHIDAQRSQKDSGRSASH